jgi:hypothetical protein
MVLLSECLHFWILCVIANTSESGRNGGRLEQRLRMRLYSEMRYRVSLLVLVSLWRQEVVIRRSILTGRRIVWVAKGSLSPTVDTWAWLPQSHKSEICMLSFSVVVCPSCCEEQTKTKLTDFLERHSLWASDRMQQRGVAFNLWMV